MLESSDGARIALAVIATCTEPRARAAFTSLRMASSVAGERTSPRISPDSTIIDRAHFNAERAPGHHRTGTAKTSSIASSCALANQLDLIMALAPRAHHESSCRQIHPGIEPASLTRCRGSANAHECAWIHHLRVADQGDRRDP